VFVGHYAASLALKSFDTRVSLGALFLAVQFVDILFFPLVLLGVERLNLIPGYTASTHFELEYMPYTHSLVASLGWAALAYAVFRWVLGKGHGWALVMAVAVFSHWVLDLFVHTPDLPLMSDASPKLGLGLWNHAGLTFLLEAALLLGGLWLYLRSTRAVGRSGRYAMALYVAVLIAVNVANIWGPPPESKVALAVAALVAYFGFAGVAYWLDQKRAATPAPIGVA
jgi:hypothetical protein